jgi:Tol biopolymer transport system component
MLQGATLESVRGKILFWSDRQGEPRVFVMDVGCIFWDGGCRDAPAVPLRDQTIYDQALNQESLAADGSGRAVVLENERGVFQVYLDDYLYDVTVPMTAFAGMAYDPAWSPRSRRVALVSTEPGNHEIYTIAVDGSDLRRLTFDGARDQHPTWAPNGMAILFHSDRDGRRQLWLMNADGSSQRNVSNNQYNDWDPIWVK